MRIMIILCDHLCWIQIWQPMPERLTVVFCCVSLYSTVFLCTPLCFSVFHCVRVVFLCTPLCFSVFHCVRVVFLCIPLCSRRVSLCSRRVSLCSTVFLCVPLCLTVLCGNVYPTFVTRGRLSRLKPCLCPISELCKIYVLFIVVLVIASRYYNFQNPLNE
jgi:hypothetical protein